MYEGRTLFSSVPCLYPSGLNICELYKNVIFHFYYYLKRYFSHIGYINENIMNVKINLYSVRNFRTFSSVTRIKKVTKEKSERDPPEFFNEFIANDNLQSTTIVNALLSETIFNPRRRWHAFCSSI